MKRLIVLAALAASSTAHAEFLQDPKVRFGVGFLKSEIDYEDVDLEFDSKGWEVFVGYEFNPYFAVEAGYADPGDDTVRLGSVSATLEPASLHASVLGSLPIGDAFSIFGRVGLLHWEADGRVSSGPTVITTKDDGDDPIFGLGAAALVQEALLRLEYRLADIDDAELRVLSLSIAWRF